MPISPWGLAQVVKEWGGFVGGSRFKSQWGQKFTYQIKNNNKNKIKAPEHFGGQGMI